MYLVLILILIYLVIAWLCGMFIDVVARYNDEDIQKSIFEDGLFVYYSAVTISCLIWPITVTSWIINSLRK